MQSTDYVHTTEPAGCAQGFLDIAVLRHVMASTSITTYPGATQPITPLQFACSATLKKWTLGAKINEEGTTPTEICVYRGPMRIPVCIHLLSLKATPYLNVYEYEFSQSSLVQPGDHIGLVYHANSSSQIYYQRRYGPMQPIDLPLIDLPLIDLPLISVTLEGWQLHCSCLFNTSTHLHLLSQAAHVNYVLGGLLIWRS